MSNITKQPRDASRRRYSQFKCSAIVIQIFIHILLQVIFVSSTPTITSNQTEYKRENGEIRDLTASYFHNGNQLHPLNANITLISFQNNSIIWIDYNTFTAFPNLTTLNLANNQLDGIDFYAPSIVIIDMAFNEITNLSVDIFERLPSLQYLNLCNNQLTSVEWILPSTIPLTTMDISENVALQQVYIDSAKVHSLFMKSVGSVELVLKTPALETLDLRGTLPVNTAITELCNVADDIHILVYFEEVGAGLFECPARTQNAHNQPQVKSLKSLALLPTGSGCEYSTLRVDPETIVLTAEEMALINFYFVILSCIVVLLCLVLMASLMVVCLRQRRQLYREVDFTNASLKNTTGRHMV